MGVTSCRKGFRRDVRLSPHSDRNSGSFFRSPRQSTPAEYTGQRAVYAGRRLCGSADLVDKHDTEHFAAGPDDFASLADKRMRYGRKSKPASDSDTDLSHELRTVQRHIQDLTLVADEAIVEREPRSVLSRSSRFALLICSKHQNAIPC